MNFDFNWILVPVTLLFFFIWLLDKLVFKQRALYKQKLQALQRAEAELQQHQQYFTQLETQSQDKTQLAHAQDKLSQARLQVAEQNRILQQYKGNFLINWSYDFWPVLAVILVLRSFFYEPFNIPSESMNPTLETGDFILVNKYTYGIRLPLINQKIIDVNAPKHGDVVVFRYPEQPRISYIKRVVGVPGDKITFQNGVIIINGVKQPYDIMQNVALPVTIQTENSTKQTISVQARQWRSTLGTHQFLVQYINLEQTDPKAQAFVQSYQMQPLGLSLTENWTVEVPQDKYFVMGDNRDQSSDSRFWGFVPEENLIGKATYLWMHKAPGFNLPTFSRNGLIP